MKKYLLDANIFITPYNSYYAFDFGYSFWNQLKYTICSKRAIVINSVFQEICYHKEDDLSEWLKNITDPKPFNETRNAGIVNNYGQILRYIQECGYYKPMALENWANNKIADPWIIATAMHFNEEKTCEIVTMEQSTGVCLKSKNPKILKFQILLNILRFLA